MGIERHMEATRELARLVSIHHSDVERIGHIATALSEAEARGRRQGLEEAVRVIKPFAAAADGRKSKELSSAVCFGQEHLLAARALLSQHSGASNAE